MLRSVETRYNHAQTLQVLFRKACTAPGQPRRTESGTLPLLKPGRMRGDYTSREGKLFVSDGKYLWLYSGAGMSAILSGWNATGLRGCSFTGGSLIP